MNRQELDYPQHTVDMLRLPWQFKRMWFYELGAEPFRWVPEATDRHLELVSSLIDSYLAQDNEEVVHLESMVAESMVTAQLMSRFQLIDTELDADYQFEQQIGGFKQEHPRGIVLMRRWEIYLKSQLN